MTQMRKGRPQQGGPRRGGGGKGRTGGATKRSAEPVEELHPNDEPPDIESFSEWDLGREVQQAIADMGITSPTPIQKLAIGPVLEGRDVIAKAETGTGKTLAFGAPMIAKLDPARSTVLGLVLCPTRELAQQVAQVLTELGRARGIKVALLVGGDPIPPQVKALHAGAQLVVATPGRVLDLAGQRFLNFPWTEFAVLDEADEMLEIGFLDDVRKILDLLPEERQTLLFSATFPPPLLELARSHTKNPVELATAKGVATVDRIVQHVCFVNDEDRANVMRRLLMDSGPDDLFLVFCERRTDVDRLFRRLERLPFGVKALHGGYDQAARFRVMSAFRGGEVRALIATDVASRGLDVSGVTHVINFGVPREVSDYTHRIGRTGRAGRSGHALTFVPNQDTRRWREIAGRMTWTVDEIAERDLRRVMFTDPEILLERGAAEAPAQEPEREERPRRGRDEAPRAEREERPRRSRDEEPRAERGERPRRSRDESPRTEREERPRRSRDESPRAEREERPRRSRDESPRAEREERPRRSRDESPRAEREERPRRNRDEAPSSEREERPRRSRDESPRAEREERPRRSRDESPRTEREERPRRSRDEAPSAEREERPRRSRDESPRTERDERPRRSRDEAPSAEREERPRRSRDESPRTEREERPRRSRDEAPSAEREERPRRSRDESPRTEREERPRRSRDEAPSSEREERPRRSRDESPRAEREERPRRNRDEAPRAEREERPRRESADRAPRRERPRTGSEESAPARGGFGMGLDESPSPPKRAARRESQERPERIERPRRSAGEKSERAPRKSDDSGAGGFGAGL
ncbi:DEAD/DEAH box helicase [Engelhardtia mirabilis]|uniref:Putative DEAD-box ATP-dependent RNA helicase n=1 Tax=Engelhardtia mirabilis TaxID=2528011 RepID=A0A518BHV6_9BACT|nr:putative DEAD-box ATP-dependent RNA helicase [Planctomycetes bacterium Pla133]QDV00871.1 putative DEAD-box ATP-dependent RNA helicase [Planctomycetes bacterium Pla86]